MISSFNEIPFLVSASNLHTVIFRVVIVFDIISPCTIIIGQVAFLGEVGICWACNVDILASIFREDLCSEIYFLSLANDTVQTHAESP